MSQSRVTSVMLSLPISDFVVFTIKDVFVHGIDSSKRGSLEMYTISFLIVFGMCYVCYFSFS